jgi:hypothetical protein
MNRLIRLGVGVEEAVNEANTTDFGTFVLPPFEKTYPTNSHVSFHDLVVFYPLPFLDQGKGKR